jgi:hypothetical protein
MIASIRVTAERSSGAIIKVHAARGRKSSSASIGGTRRRSEEFGIKRFLKIDFLRSVHTITYAVSQTRGDAVDHLSTRSRWKTRFLHSIMIV